MPKSKKNNSKKKKQDLLSKELRLGEKYYFEALEGIYLILDSGQDLLTSVISAKEDATDSKLKGYLGRIATDLSKGAPFWKSLQVHRLIPQRYIQILRVGEESGILRETLKITIEQNRHENELKGKVLSALSYPALVLFLTLIIGLGVSWFVLPQLTQVYTSFGGELPFTTKILVSFADFTRIHGYWFYPSILLSILVFIIAYFVSKKVQKFVEQIVLRIPGVRSLVVEAEISRLGFIFGNLLNVGISVDKAIESLIEATPLFTYRALYQEMYDNIMMGSSFSLFFKTTNPPARLISSAVRHLIISGEKSGSLPKVFLDIGEIYKNRMNKTSDNLSRFIEPILLIIMWAFVAILAIGIIMPIYSQLNNLEY